MKKLLIFGMSASLFATLALANGEALYKKCIVCHGPDGGKTPPGHNKIIKDLSKDEIATTLRGYKDGTYGGKLKALMLGQVKPLSDEDIDAIADYIGE